MDGVGELLGRLRARLNQSFVEVEHESVRLCARVREGLELTGGNFREQRIRSLSNKIPKEFKVGLNGGVVVFSLFGVGQISRRVRRLAGVALLGAEAKHVEPEARVFAGRHLEAEIMSI